MRYMKKTCAGLCVILFALSMAFAQTDSEMSSKTTPEETRKSLAALIEQNSFYRLESSENRISDVKFKGCQLEFKTKSVFIRPRRENLYQDANMPRKDADLFKNYSAETSVTYSVSLSALDVDSFRSRPVASKMFNTEPETNYRLTALQENLIALRIETIAGRNEVRVKVGQNTVPSSFISLVVRKEAAERIENGLSEVVRSCRE